MPVPAEYQRARADFYAFLEDLRDEAGLPTTNTAYTTAQGVLQAFRRRLTVEEAIRFAGVLPVGLRALFVADWDPAEPRREFTDSRAAMTREVRGLRPGHNLAPDSAIADTAVAIRRCVDPVAFERVLAGLPAGAGAFWGVPDAGSGSP